MMICPSLDPKVDSKIVQLDLLPVAVVLLFYSFAYYFNMFLSFISIDHKASILRLSKPGLSILFKSGPMHQDSSVCPHGARF